MHPTPLVAVTAYARERLQLHAPGVRIAHTRGAVLAHRTELLAVTRLGEGGLIAWNRRHRHGRPLTRREPLLMLRQGRARATGVEFKRLFYVGVDVRPHRRIPR